MRSLVGRRPLDGIPSRGVWAAELHPNARLACDKRRATIGPGKSGVAALRRGLTFQSGSADPRPAVLAQNATFQYLQCA